METHEPVSSSNTAALLSQFKPSIQSHFLERLRAQGQDSSCLAAVLPELLDGLLLALADASNGHNKPPMLDVRVPLGSIVSELGLLRDVLETFLSGHVDISRMHRFLDRCLEAAASTHEEVEREAQKRLFDFFQLVPIPICVVMGEEKRVTFANSSFLDFVARPVLGMTLQEIFSHEEVAPYLPYIENVLATGKPCFLKELKVLASIGTGQGERWIDTSYYPLGDVGSPPRGVIALHYDVTDQVQHRMRRELSERRLKQTEDQLSRAAIVSKVGFFDWDMRQNLIHLNRQMRLDWGTDAESYTPDELEAMIHVGDLEQIRAAGRRAIAERCSYATQCRVVRPSDHKIVWVEVQGEITYDDDNKPLRFFGTSRNITERKEAELKLSAEKHKFEVIFREAPASMALWKGPDFVFELVNPQFERFFQGRQFIGKTLCEALPEFLDQPFLNLLRQVYETGKTFVASEFPAKVARCKGGPLEDCYLDFSLARIHDDMGQPYGVFSHTVNVTDKVRARDEARAASLSKSHFLANMSHEIRTPLAAILGFSALLRDPNLPDSEREVFVDTIVRNGQALTRIIDDILDLAKVEAGRLEMEHLEFSLPELIDEVLLLFKDRVQQKHLQLTADIAADVPERIASDPLRLRQILVNLVGNAVKFTNKGSVQILCRAAKHGDGFDLTIDTRDTGIGLSPEQKERLFQPFAQADQSTTRKFGGTGLGLALSQRLAEALGGRITIPHSAPGQGSTFSLQFKVQEATTTAEPQLKGPAPSMDAYQLRGVRVLAVDDSPDNLFLVKSFLAKSGAIVATAADGRHAIELAGTHAYDIILLDIQMPEMDGYQTIQKLREQGFKNPIVALTAHAMVDERHHTQQAGFNAHLTKPLDALELIATVSRLARCPPAVWMGNELRG
ncbi:PAS domain-containing protein [Oligoflexus tunisiensis]|uniref:PAS domain-containing protein n=1 Tax=Oligoflexus tunisiensis TaxID=708132 RepID=UPI00159F1105|nr:PAS domain-containing protein [Oligoflexus tunisiensis]